MKKTLTLFVIASVVLFSVGCQKDDLPVKSGLTNEACVSSVNCKSGNGSHIKLQDITGDKKVQNAVACKACHAYRDGAVN